MMPLRKSITLCAALGLGFAASQSSAQTLTLISPTVNDGGFESITAKSNFTAATSATAAIPYWGATDTSPVGGFPGDPPDSGAETNTTLGAAGNNSATHSGVAGSFYQPNQSSAFNLVTTSTITANTVYTLTWFGRTTGNTGQQAVSLFSQLTSSVAAGTAYMYTPSATLISVDGSTNTTYAFPAANSNYAQFSLTYTSTAADVGKYIGLTFGNSGGSYISGDDFTLTAATVPEPSTYVEVSAGLAVLLLVARSKRVLV